MVTLADRLMVTDMVVILSGVWLPMPKYSGTNASHMTHVVYIVKPVEQNINEHGEIIIYPRV